MNFYFVFEGKTEEIVYKKWISVLLPELIEVDSFDAVTDNNYYYECDMGIPDCYRVVANAMQDINEHPKYDYLILFIDADRLDVEEKKKEANEHILNNLKGKNYQKLPDNCQLIVIVQKVCIETWFLGNRKFFVRNPKGDLLRKYIEYFDVSVNDPENLGYEFVQNEEGTARLFGYSTKALFHESYLREIFKEKENKHLSYKKSKPMEVQEKHFLEQIQLRVKDNPTHLFSFQKFLCEILRK